jgi:esterase/lipase
MKNRTKIFLIVLLAMVILFAFGPSPQKFDLSDELPTVEVAEPSTIKPENENYFWFSDSAKTKTKFVILYLHGFSASPMEGSPVMQDIAKNYGCNLYAPRLQAHGLISKEPMLEFDNLSYWESVKAAFVKAKTLGDSVIVMGTSTGCTAALILASKFPEIHSLVLYSPNIDLYDSRSFLLTMPWGLQLARRVENGNYHSFIGPEGTEKYWTTKYRLEALVELKSLLNISMKTETFQKVKQPLLMLYYYKNEQEQDNVVSVKAMLKMFDELGSVEEKKKKVAMPNVGAHAMASNIWSKDIEGVIHETKQFMDDLLK